MRLPHPPHNPLPFRRRQAFTLVELLCVIAIVGILAAILIPVVGSVRESARIGACVSNLRQIGTAFQLYAADNRGLYPAPRQADTSNPSANQNPLLGPWQLELASYISPKLRADNMYRLKEAAIEHNAALCPAYVRLFPSQEVMRDSGLNALGYGMNFNLNVGGSTLNTASGRVTRFRAALITHPARSVLVGDSSDYHLDGKTTGWELTSASNKPDGYNSGAPTRHRGKANYLFADGHVETLTPDDALDLLPFQS